MIRKSQFATWVVVAVNLGCATPPPPTPRSSVPPRSCRPGLSCWPSPAEWEALAAQLLGKLEQPQSPLQACRVDFNSMACAVSRRKLKNPFALQDDPGGTQSVGWMGAWEAADSAYAVAAADVPDVVAAVNFAREHGIAVVVKGTGHDYLGRSNAPNSLLIWTHLMRRITVHDAFVGQGCPHAQSGVPAVTVGAGTRWIEAYQEVTVRHGRYVQGGGCTSVGAAGGFMQGGGFGSFSKKYGIAAAGMLEAQVVTADGKLVVANACQNQDLFWALRGGGGGTFGVVTQVTLMTHPAPNLLGFIVGSLQAKSDDAFRELLDRFITFYRESLLNEAWGEQIRVRGSNRLDVAMSFAGLSGAEAKRVWEPFLGSLSQHSDRFTVETQVLEIPGNKMWSYEFAKEHAPSFVEADDRTGQPGNLFWWKNDTGQIAAYWYTYQSRWIPAALFEPGNAKALAATLFDASRHWSLELHFNKGQAGASADAQRRDAETSMNRAVMNAAALLIAAADGSGAPGVAGHEPDLKEGEKEKAAVSAAMKIIRAATPEAGSYVNETDYFEPEWQRSFWGDNYPRLLAIKRKVDPDGFFWCHHCIGSE